MSRIQTWTIGLVTLVMVLGIIGKGYESWAADPPYGREVRIPQRNLPSSSGCNIPLSQISDTRLIREGEWSGTDKQALQLLNSDVVNIWNRLEVIEATIGLPINRGIKQPGRAHAAKPAGGRSLLQMVSAVNASGLPHSEYQILLTDEERLAATSAMRQSLVFLTDDERKAAESVIKRLVDVGKK